MRMVRPAGRTGLLAEPQGACPNPMWGSCRGATRGQWVENIRDFLEVPASCGASGRVSFCPPAGLGEPAALLEGGREPSRMTLVSIPANPVPDAVVTGTIK